MILAALALISIATVLASLIAVTAEDVHRDPPVAGREASSPQQVASRAADDALRDTAASRQQRRCPQLGEILPELVEATACGDTGRIRALIGSGADPDETDPRAAFRGYSPLHHAVARGDRPAIELLLQAGAAADLQDAEGNAPLHLLVLHEKIVDDAEIAHSLIRAGADVTLRNRSGRSVLDELKARPRLARARAELAGYLEQTVRQQDTVLQARSYLDRRAPTSDSVAILEEAVAMPAPGAGGSEAAISEAEAAENEIRALIATWAAAWSRKDVDAYLASYDRDFAVPEGRSRQGWEALRRQRIEASSRISVSVTALSLEIGAERAIAHFVQTYRTPEFEQEGPKTLVLARRPGGWAIVEEHDDR